MSTTNISLREVRSDDLIKVFEWLNDYDLRTYSAPYKPVSWLEHVSWVEKRLTEGRETFFIIAHSDNAIGVINLSTPDPIHQSAEFSIRIGNVNDRGKGFGTEALKQLIHYCWNDLNLHRLSLSVISSNHHAIKSYINAGFAVEGEMRDAAFIAGQWRSMTVMAILNSRS
jgi:UDP-4-amino-4,6-dideoxy-N-acetyl-beta-L-altrosamine N-acetyltransferase